MECQYGLLTKLTCRKVITHKQKSHIESSRDSYAQNKTLLDIMLLVTDQRKLKQFLEVLRLTNQRHIAAYILNDGGRL